jgi:acyl dehydratase
VTVRMTVAELEQARDLDLGVSDWVVVTQEQVDMFAQATGDHQWIHVDRERAGRGPFGGTIAHGYLTLSMLPALVAQLLDVTDSAMGVNYGLDRLRLTGPVPVGSKIRVRGQLLDSTSKSGGVLYRVEMEVEIEGGKRPALVATGLYLVYGQS